MEVVSSSYPWRKVVFTHQVVLASSFVNTTKGNNTLMDALLAHGKMPQLSPLSIMSKPLPQTLL